MSTLNSIEPMKDASKDEQEEDLVVRNRADEKSKNARSQRAEQLRKMMEDDGNPHCLSGGVSLLTRPPDAEMEDEGEEAPDTSQGSAALDKPTPLKEPTPEPPPVVIQGRRRGRRKVMKKKTVKDEEGYLGKEPPPRNRYLDG